MRQAWGRYFTRNPETGSKRASAEVFTSEVPVRQPLIALQQSFPEASARLQQSAADEETRLRDAAVLEFYLEEGVLQVHSVEPLPRSPQAACKIAVALVQEGLISRAEALLRVEREDLHSMLQDSLEECPTEPLYQGQSMTAGIATGRIVLSAAEAGQCREPVILLCDRLTYAERDCLHLVSGLILRSGPAMAARHHGIPCLLAPDCILDEGQWVTLDASSGNIFPGELPVRAGDLSADACTLLEWTGEWGAVKVRANVSSPHEAQLASLWGAEGVGLCRFESVMLDSERLPLFQTVFRQICEEKLTDSPEFELLIRELSQDVGELLAAGSGPFNLRLLDAPVSQMLCFWRDSGLLPEGYFAGEMSTWLHELNAMQGLRCGRLGLVYPSLVEIQLKAILRGWGGQRPRLQVMLPGTCDAQELRIFRRLLVQVAEQEEVVLPEVGSMLELPRACLLADQLAAEVDFLSFGTGDLTEATCGISRYDAPLSFLPAYLEKGVFSRDPFEALDQDGVGELMRLACEQVKAKYPSVEMGTCGAQAVDPESLAFCVQLGLDYVSVPVRNLPAARLAVAQAALRPDNLRLRLPRLHRS